MKNHRLDPYRALMVAVLMQAVTDAKGESGATKAEMLDAIKWLGSNGPEWCQALGIGLPIPAFYDWLDRRAQAWERA